MSNVLTVASQKKAQHFFRARFVLTGSLALLLGAALVLLALTPAILRSGQWKSTEVAGEGVQAVSAEDVEQSRIEVLRAQALLEQFRIGSAYDRETITALEVVLHARPAGVSVRDIQYTVESSGEATLVLRGIAAERTNINAYRNALSGEEIFTSVSVPVGAFAEAEEGRFSITLTGAF